jgi:serine phosphatase RsbU (regulator of sigma subunit)
LHISLATEGDWSIPRAGHPAILHYHATSKEISEVTCSNLPLGMFDAQQFVTGSLECGRDDLFLFFTDGLLEIADAKGEEFGLAGVKAVMSAQAGAPVSAIFQGILDASKRHGRATDDQSLLLVRSHVGMS